MEHTEQRINLDVDRRFGESVRELRTAQGWSQEELADRMRSRGIEDAAALRVSRLENGQRRVRLDEVLTLSEVFKIPVRSMVKQDPTLNTLVLLREMERRYRRAMLDYQQAISAYQEQVLSTAEDVVQIVEETRANAPELDPDAAEALDRFKQHAEKASALSASEFAQEVEAGRGVRTW